MRARCVSYTETSATVVLEPSWLARLFGARAVAVDIVKCKSYCGQKLDVLGSKLEWYTASSETRVADMSDGAEILRALDFREVGTDSRHTRVTIGGAVAP